MLRLRLLGAPSVDDDARAIHLPSQKAQALLFYLAAEPARSFTRSQLIALLWEESAEREGRNSLSTVLSRLRQALPALPIRAEGDTLAWHSSEATWVDLHDFQAEARPVADPVALSAAQLQQLEAAVALYRGSFLDGFSIRDSESFEEWLRIERERWQQRWLNALDQLVTAYTAQGAYARALEHAGRALEADPLQERFHRALMRLRYLAGDRAAALAQFRLCREILERELGVEPDDETVALYQAIGAGRLERASQPPAPPPQPVLPRHAPAPRLAARLAAARRRSFVGRAAELAMWDAALAAEVPPFVVLYIYGPGGVGKSSLLREYAERCARAGVRPIVLDGRNIPPTADGFLQALGEALGAEDALSALPERCTLLIDTYELLTPIESWLREQLLPQLPEQALVVLAGRNAPSAGWRVDPGWQEVTRVLALGNLNTDEAAEYLERRQIAPDQRDAVLRFTHCYPLALSLAAEVLLQRPGSQFDTATTPDVVRVLLDRFVAGVPSVAHRAALEACSQVRITSEPLLSAMLDMPEAHMLFEWLRDLSFISTGARGIFPHDLAREALAADLTWRNPPWRRELHQRARHYYLAEFARANGHAQYVTLLDLIFLHDNPLIRSISTWNEIGGLLEDTPRAIDWPGLVEIVRAHEGDESAALAARWFERRPESAIVFRDSSGAVTGFLCILALRPDDLDLIAADPGAAAAWRSVTARPPLPQGKFAAMVRFWMDRDGYQALSPTQGMIFVATTRYLLTTPGLAYSFHVFAQPEMWQPFLEQVQIWRFTEGDFTVGGRRYAMFMHDWLAQPPHVWLETLAEHEVQG